MAGAAQAAGGARPPAPSEPRPGGRTVHQRRGGLTAEEIRRSTYALLDSATGKLPLATKLTYSAPAFATTSLSFLISVYANDFYISLGAGLAFLSFFTALARSFDVMTDPLMGWMSDRIRSRFGRRRPFIAIGAPFYLVFFTLLFRPPPSWSKQKHANDAFHLEALDGDDSIDTTSPAIAYWFGCFYTLFYFADTFSNVPYEALGPELTDSYDERNSLFFTMKMFYFMGLLFAAGAPATFSYMYRKGTKAQVERPCRDFYNPFTRSVDDGTGVDEASCPSWNYGHFNRTHQLIYIDKKASGALDAGVCNIGACVEKSAKLLSGASGVEVPPCCKKARSCEGSSGQLCFEERFADDSRYFYEVEPDIAESMCAGSVNVTYRRFPGDTYFDATNEKRNCSSLFGGGLWPGDIPADTTAYCPLGHGLNVTAACNVAGNALSFTWDNETTVTFDRFGSSSLDSMRYAYFVVALLFGLYYLVTSYYLVFRIQERAASTEGTTPVPLVPSILRSFRNRAFRPLLVAWALDGLALSSLVTMFPFFIRYVIKPDGQKAKEGHFSMSPQQCMGYSMVGLLFAAMCSAPFWLWLSGYIGKYKSWLVYNAVNALTNIIFLWPAEGDPFFTICCMTLNGLPVGGQFLIQSILADVIDYDEFLHGSRSEAAFSVFATLIPKFVSIPASAIPLAIVNLLGFREPVDGVDQPQKPGVQAFIRTVFIMLPFFCVVTAFFIKSTFPIKTKAMTNAIATGVARHMKGQGARDPLTGKTVTLLDFTEAEVEQAWLFENFHVSDLKELARTHDAAPVVQKMYTLVAVAAGLVTFFFTLVCCLFDFLDSKKLAILPILSVILLGITTCFLVVNILRYRDALKLETHIQDEENKKLLVRVMAHKELIDPGPEDGKGFGATLREAITSLFDGSLFNEDTEDDASLRRPSVEMAGGSPARTIAVNGLAENELAVAATVEDGDEEKALQASEDGAPGTEPGPPQARPLSESTAQTNPLLAVSVPDSDEAKNSETRQDEGKGQGPSSTA